MNPLWIDAEHGKSSRYGRCIAPPALLYGVTWGAWDTRHLDLAVGNDAAFDQTAPEKNPDVVRKGVFLHRSEGFPARLTVPQRADRTLLPVEVLLVLALLRRRVRASRARDATSERRE